jgi:hypothetical protein
MMMDYAYASLEESEEHPTEYGGVDSSHPMTSPAGPTTASLVETLRNEGGAGCEMIESPTGGCAYEARGLWWQRHALRWVRSKLLQDLASARGALVFCAPLTRTAPSLRSVGLLVLSTFC